LRRSYLLIRVTEGRAEDRMEVMGRRGRSSSYRMVLKKREDTEIERESIRCRSVNNLLWKRL
jgi:hypothetical protein